MSQRNRSRQIDRQTWLVVGLLAVIAVGVAGILWQTYGSSQSTIEVTHEVTGLNNTDLFTAVGKRSSEHCPKLVRVRATFDGSEVLRSGWSCVVSFTSGVDQSLRYFIDIKDGDRGDISAAADQFTAPGSPATEGFYRGLVTVSPTPSEEQLRTLRKQAARYTLVTVDQQTGGTAAISVGWPAQQRQAQR